MTKEIKARSLGKQLRSKEKKEKLIQTTKNLIGTKGSADVSMREIANLADIPIGTVYHYYPNKDAILSQIMQQTYELLDHKMDILFQSIQMRHDLKPIISQAVDSYFDLFNNDPTMAIIWASVQASPDLLKLDIKDCYKKADTITKTLTKKFPKFDQKETYNACFSLMNYASYLSRMISFIDDNQAQEIRQELQTTIALRVQYLLDH